MSDCETDDIVREYEERDEQQNRERRNSGNRVELSDNEEGNNSSDEDKETNDKKKDDQNDGSDKKVEVKKKKGIRKLVVLNAEVLKNKNKGVHKIEEYFENFTFLGNKHERQDLDRIMKRLEHWSHRLFPKYNFDDFLEKVEQIGMKKTMNTFLMKYRQDMLTDQDFPMESGETLDEEKENVVIETAEDLFKEHVEYKSRQMTQDTGTNVPPPISTLSEEAKQRMERNKQLALEKKRARMLEKQKQLEETIVQNVDLTSTERSQTVVEESTQNAVAQENDGLSLQEKIEMKRQMALARKMARLKEKEEREKQAFSQDGLNESQNLSNSFQNNPEVSEDREDIQAVSSKEVTDQFQVVPEINTNMEEISMDVEKADELQTVQDGEKQSSETQILEEVTDIDAGRSQEKGQEMEVTEEEYTLE